MSFPRQPVQENKKKTVEKTFLTRCVSNPDYYHTKCTLKKAIWSKWKWFLTRIMSCLSVLQAHTANTAYTINRIRIVNSTTTFPVSNASLKPANTLLKSRGFGATNIPDPNVVR